MTHEKLVDWYGKRVRVTLSAAKDAGGKARDDEGSKGGTFEGILEHAVGEQHLWAIVRGMDPKLGYDAVQFEADQVTEIVDLWLEDHTEVDPHELHKTPDGAGATRDPNAKPGEGATEFKQQRPGVASSDTLPGANPASTPAFRSSEPPRS